MQVVFDTNVFVSALVIPSSLSEEAYRRAIAREFQLVTRVAEVVKTVPHLEVVRDATDNRILDCAETAAADLIVTGDLHLLKLRRFGTTGIVKVSTFLHTLG